MSEPIKLRQLCRHYTLGQRQFAALDNLTATIADGSFTVIVGPSGCGKTTLLRLLGGLEAPSSGQLQLGERSVGLVFQEPRLMPWLTVAENIAFPLLASGRTPAGDQQVDALLAQLGLTDFRQAYPAQISGGMAQRAAIGRTLCQNPDLILMDEPFGALDYFTRRKLQRELLQLFQTYRKTIVFVTHDVDEALCLGQHILVMRDGRLLQEVTLSEPYPRAEDAPALLTAKRTLLALLQDTAEEDTPC